MNNIIIIITAFIIFLIIVNFTLHIMSLKEWLVYACIEAEQFLGSKTGQLKLRYVYNLSITRFPFIAKILPFGLFLKLVDKSLKTMMDMLENNKSIKDIICDTVSDIKDSIDDSN